MPQAAAMASHRLPAARAAAVSRTRSWSGSRVLLEKQAASSATGLSIKAP